MGLIFYVVAVFIQSALESCLGMLKGVSWLVLHTLFPNQTRNFQGYRAALVVLDFLKHTRMMAQDSSNGNLFFWQLSDGYGRLAAADRSKKDKVKKYFHHRAEF